MLRTAHRFLAKYFTFFKCILDGIQVLVHLKKDLKSDEQQSILLALLLIDTPVATKSEFAVTKESVQRIVPGFGIISQGATLLHPDKDHLMVYACQGRIPKSILDKPYKVNWAANAVVIFSILCYTTTTFLPIIKRLWNKTSVDLLPTSFKQTANNRHSKVGSIFRYFSTSRYFGPREI